MLRIAEDLKTIQRKDPAARGALEILLCYPGLHVQWFHRVAHPLWKWGVPLLPRLLSHVARFLTGIEIHPGAVIGRRVFIDHGMGVVIGETAEVGDDCLIYQDVTLGGTSLSHGKRHPTLEECVVVGSGARILGNIRIGHHSRIGSGSVVVKSAPPRSTIVGVPGRIVEEGPARDDADHTFDHQRIPDTTAKAITALREQMHELEREVEELRHQPVTVTLPRGLSTREIEQAFQTMSRSAEDEQTASHQFDEGAGI